MAYNIRVEVVSSRLMMMSLWLELSRGRFAGDDDGDDVLWLEPSREPCCGVSNLNLLVLSWSDFRPVLRFRTIPSFSNQ